MFNRNTILHSFSLTLIFRILLFYVIKITHKLELNLQPLGFDIHSYGYQII